VFHDTVAPAWGDSLKEAVPMIALVKKQKTKRSQQAWHDAFLKMLPSIVRQARIAFRYMPAEPREEAVAEVTAMCWAAFVRLVERDKQDVAAPSALARYAVAQYRDGRRATGRQSPKDVMSTTAQRRKGFGIEPLKQFDARDESWQEIAEDKRATPAEIAITRIDFAAWLKMLPRKSRKIALMLATGETTSEAAVKFGVSAARISQIRLWLRLHWDVFQTETSGKVEMAAA
jgi:hypothetical protein